MPNGSQGAIYAASTLRLSDRLLCGKNCGGHELSASYEHHLSRSLRSSIHCDHTAPTGSKGREGTVSGCRRPFDH